MKNFIAFLLSICLSVILIGAMLPTVTAAEIAPLYDVLECPAGNVLSVIIYEDHAEFYFSPNANSLFAALSYSGELITKVSVRTVDNKVHNYKSIEAFLVEYPEGVCPVALAFLDKQASDSI